jgi:hypothetical protein
VGLQNGANVSSFVRLGGFSLEEEGLGNGARVDFNIRKETLKHQKICPKSSLHPVQGFQFGGRRV